ncbi:hypothetical protein V2J09_023781 [Rumex salicifolius]
MGYKALRLAPLSAKGQKSVSHIGKMHVYVEVSISGDPRTKKKTPVDREGGSSPSWNHTVSFSFDEATAINGNWSVVFKLKHHRTLWKDKVLGEVRVPVKDLLGNKKRQTAMYKVRRPCGKLEGELEFSYKESDAVKPNPRPVYGGHVAPHQQSGCGRHNDGFGLGLAAGLIGGVLVEEMVSDAYDDGYYDARAADYDF